MSSGTTHPKDSETDNIENKPECTHVIDFYRLFLPVVTVLADEVKKDQDSEEELEDEPSFDL